MLLNSVKIRFTMPRQKAAPAHAAYHHGTLRDALVEATEAILGFEALTQYLREGAQSGRQ